MYKQEASIHERARYESVLYTEIELTEPSKLDTGKKFLTAGLRNVTNSPGTRYSETSPLHLTAKISTFVRKPTILVVISMSDKIKGDQATPS